MGIHQAFTLPLICRMFIFFVYNLMQPTSFQLMLDKILPESESESCIFLSTKIIMAWHKCVATIKLEITFTG